MHKKLLCLSLSLVFTAQACASEQLIFAVDVIRHGDRTAFQDILPIYEWPQGLGELTPLGMQQEYQLGQTKRQQYIKQYHLLPANYQVSTMYVRSSDYNRTLMSAESFLLGLYPLGTGPSLPRSISPALPQAYQPIPIHTAPMDHDPIFFPIADSELSALKKQYIYSDSEWQAKEKALAPKFAQWSEASGLKLNSLDQIIGLGDNLYIRKLYHVPMPAISKEDQQTIIDTGLWALTKMYVTPGIGQAISKNLIIDIKQHLMDAANNKTKLKYVLYSAHDTTILSLLGDFGTTYTDAMPYGSDLNIMLFKTEQKTYRVKVILNGKAVAIPACHDKVCTLDEFNQIP